MIDLIDNHFYVFCCLVGVSIGVVFVLAREIFGYLTKTNEILQEIKNIKFQLNQISHNYELFSNQSSEIENVNLLIQKVDEIDAFITDYQMFDYEELNNKMDAICRKLEIQI